MMAAGARSAAGPTTPPDRRPGRIPPLAITAYTVSTALGAGVAANLQALRTRRSGLRPNDFTEPPLETWIGRIDCLEAAPLPQPFAHWECRNNRLA